MTRKMLMSAIVMLFVLQAGQASAKEGLFGAGARFTWDNYKAPLLVQRDPATGENIEPNKFGSPSFAGEFHVIPIDRLVISLSLDVGMMSYKVFPFQTGDAETEYEIKATYFTFGFLLGAKFYIIEPTPKKATLYVFLGGGKYFSKLKNDDPNADATLDAELEAVGKLASPTVIKLALGAEFFVTNGFSVGADILGFRINFASYDNSGLGAMASSYSGEQKYMSFSIYSALTMNFGFSGKGGKSKDKDWESDEEAWSGGGSTEGSATAGEGATAGDAGGDDGWGTPSEDTSGGGNDGWGQPADGGGGGDGWGSPAPQPADGNSGGGWEAAPPPSSGGDDGGGGGAAKPKPKKPKAGGGGSTPPPPPPGY